MQFKKNPGEIAVGRRPDPWKKMKNKSQGVQEVNRLRASQRQDGEKTFARKTKGKHGKKHGNTATWGMGKHWTQLEKEEKRRTILHKYILCISIY